MSDANLIEPQELLTPAALRSRLHISARTYARLIQQGMPWRAVRSAKRFIWSDVLDWLPKSWPASAAARRRYSGGSDLVQHLKLLVPGCRR